MEPWTLPEGWEWRCIGDLVTPASQRNPTTEPDKEFTYLDIAGIDNERGEIKETKHFVGKDAPSRARKVVRSRDVLFATTRPNLRNVAIVTEIYNNQICSTGFCVLRANTQVLLPEYLYRFCRSDSIVEQLLPRMRGASYPAVTDKDVLESWIPVPPLETQHRIVVRLEALFAQLAETRLLLNDIALQSNGLALAVYRETFGEKPGADWRTLSQYLSHIENGWSPTCEDRPAGADEWGVVKVGCVTWGSFDESANKALPRQLEPQPRFEISAGDLLMSRANTSELVGACAFVERTRPRLMLSDKIFRLIFRQDVPSEPRYFNHLLKSPALRKQIEQAATGSSPSMKNISKEKVLQLRVPPVAIDRQRELAAHLDRLLLTASEAEIILTGSMKELNELSNTILAQAFHGEL